MVAHPFNGKGSSAADNSHQALLVVHSFQGVFGYAAVDCHKIHSVFCLLCNCLENMINLDINDCFLLLLNSFSHCLVDWDGSERHRTLFKDTSAHCIKITTHA